MTIDEAMQTKFENDTHRMLASIIFTGNWIQNNFADFITPFGLSAQQFNILRILRGAKDWVTMNEVKKRMVEKSPNATRLCDKLLVKKLIYRERSANDKRSISLKISSNGLQLLKDIDDTDNSSFMEFTNNVSSEEAKTLITILDKLRG